MAQAQSSCEAAYAAQAKDHYREAKFFGVTSAVIGSVTAAYLHWRKEQALVAPLIFGTMGTPFFLADALHLAENGMNAKRFGLAMFESRQGFPGKAVESLTTLVNAAILRRAYLNTTPISEDKLIRNRDDYDYYRDQPLTSKDVAAILNALESEKSLCEDGRPLDFDRFLRRIIEQYLKA